MIQFIGISRFAMQLGLVKVKILSRNQLDYQKAFNCNICFKTFKRIGHLTVYMKPHSEDNIKYHNTCDKQFKRSDHFKKHVGNCISENIEISESLDIHKEVLLEDFPSFVASSAFPAIDPTSQNSSIDFDTFTPIKSRSPPTTIN